MFSFADRADLTPRAKGNNGSNTPKSRQAEQRVRGDRSGRHFGLPGTRECRNTLATIRNTSGVPGARRVPAGAEWIKQTSMHLPDPFLDAKTAALSAVAASAGVALAVRRVRVAIEPRQMPLLGLAGAFVFAAQMLNFPIPGGTSGHLIGGVLTAILLGPAAAVLVLTCVLIVQCLMFADGGVLALGANVFNMGLVSVCGGYLVFRAVRWSLRTMDDRRSTVLAAAFAGWSGTVLASATCAGQLALSGTAPWGVTFPAMLNIHMLIGVGEGLATGLIVFALSKAKPELLRGARESLPGAERRNLAAFGLLICVGLAAFVAPFASPWPDGLERVAETLGFAAESPQHALPAPMADYQAPWLRSAVLGTAIAGLLGTFLAFGASYALARVVVPLTATRRSTNATPEP